MVSHLEICEKAIRAGGLALVEKLGNVRVRLKSPADLVTDADLAAQRIISETLHEALPDHRIVGEEDAAGEPADLWDADYCWVIDPLDGTTNYAHSVPHFSISVALLTRGQLRLGCVFDPLRDELFSAVAGHGAQLNGHPMRTSGVVRMADALAAVGFPPRVDEHSLDLKAFLQTIEHFQALRRTGSAALNLAYVAAGRFDAAWSYCTRIWDVAAGILLVQESGGICCSPWGGKLDLRSGEFLASANDTLNQEVCRLLNSPPLDHTSPNRKQG